MLQLLDHKNHPKIRVEGGLSFLQLESSDQIDPDQLQEVDGILLKSSDKDHASTLIKAVRSNQSAQIALKPLFIPEFFKGSKELLLHIDGFYDEIQFNQLVTVTSQIQNRLKEFNWRSLSVNSFQAELGLRILRYMYSRECLLIPEHSRKSRIAYSYPYLSACIADAKAHEGLEILDHIIKEGYLQGKIIDKIHMCQKCSSNYLNFREVCTNCSSIDLSTKNIIHHFVCAHVAPEDDFMKDDELICPKCDKTLKHIGIDYDKPSVIHHCNHCEHESQQTEMKANCIDCDSESSLIELLEHPIFELELTSTGVNRALKGFDQRSNRESNSSMNKGVFQILLNQEIARVKRSNRKSVFAQVQIKDEKIDQLNPQLSMLLSKEINDVLEKHMEAPEVMINEGDFTYACLLPDYSIEGAQKKLETIKEHLMLLLGDNLELHPDRIKINFKELDGENDKPDLSHERVSA